MPEVMKTVGRYEILREVGRGGMAMVYLARQTDLDRFVALKELGAFHASDPSFAQRFLRESRVAGSLSHPNIVTVHDYFEHDGTPYIAMEYIERGSLRPYVGRMNLAQIGGVLEGLLAGLTHAEAHGIVHRDLKPENLMVTADGRVKIADFGIAKATTKMQTGAFLTATGTTVGTPTYMAPEQAMAQDIGPWTDLYSVGCMAFEMFTGNVPFHDSEAPMAILLRHVNEPIAAVKSIRPGGRPAHLGLDRARCWSRSPTQRTQNAQDAWDDFEEILLGLLGPRWRREARLVERAADTNGGAQAAHARAVPGHQRGRRRVRGVQVVRVGRARADTGGARGAADVDAAAVGVHARRSPSRSSARRRRCPRRRSRAAAAPADAGADGVTGFVTFGVPAPAAAERRAARAAPPRRARAPPPAGAEPPRRAALAEPPRRRRRPSREAAATPPAFETYIAPPPSRPPTSEPPADAAAGRGRRAGSAAPRRAAASSPRGPEPRRGHDDAEKVRAGAAEGRRSRRKRRGAGESKRPLDHPGGDRRRCRCRADRRGHRRSAAAAAARTPTPTTARRARRRSDRPRRARSPPGHRADGPGRLEGQRRRRRRSPASPTAP